MSCDKFFSLNHSGGQDENVSFVASFSADIDDIEENVLKEACECVDQRPFFIL